MRPSQHGSHVRWEALVVGAAVSRLLLHTTAHCCSQTMNIVSHVGLLVGGGALLEVM